MDIKLLICNIVFGILVIFTYVKFLGDSLKNNVTGDQLWANIKGPYRIIYYISMILAALSYMYFTYWIIFKRPSEDNNLLVWIGTILFFVGACLWAPSLYYHFIKNLNKVFVYLTLGLTSIGIILLTIYLMDKGDMISKICVSVFLYHVLIMDNIIWSIKFQQLPKIS